MRKREAHQERLKRRDVPPLAELSLKNRECQLYGGRRVIRNAEDLEELFEEAREKLPVARKK
jgi:hypothetical protein